MTCRTPLQLPVVTISPARSPSRAEAVQFASAVTEVDVNEQARQFGWANVEIVSTAILMFVNGKPSGSYEYVKHFEAVAV